MSSAGKSIRSRLFALLAMLLLSVALAACGGSDDNGADGGSGSDGDTTTATSGGGDSDEPIKIGAILAQSGPTAPYAADMIIGLEYAIEKFNEEGGVDGRKFELEKFDHAGERTQAASLAREVGSDDSFLAIIGANDSPSTLTIAPVAGQFEIPMVSPGASVPWPEEPNEYTFRVQMVNSQLIDELVPQTKEALGVEKAAIVFAYDDEFSVAAAKRFEEKAAEEGVEIVAKEQYATQDKDFRSLLTNIVNKAPDALYMSVLTENAGLMMKQARELGFKGRFVGDLGISSPAFFETGGEAANGAITGAPYDATSDRPEVQEFVKAISEQVDGTPGVYHALGYDAMLVIYEAAKAAEKPLTRQSLAASLAQLKNAPGVTGALSFDGPGDVTRDTIQLVEMQDGQYHPYKG